jgi:anti-sigma B factor antagonist
LHRADHAPRHFGHGTIAVDGDETTVPIKPLEQWSRLVLEDVEPGADHLGVVVGPTRQDGPAVLAQSAALIAADRSSALGTHQTCSEPLRGFPLRDHELDHGVEHVGREQLVERDSLIDRAREPVEDEPVAFDVVLFEPPRQRRQDEVVGHELPGIHVLLRASSDRRFLFDLGAQQLSGGDVGNAQHVGEAGALGALAGPRTPEHSDPNRTARHHLPTPGGATPGLDHAGDYPGTRAANRWIARIRRPTSYAPGAMAPPFNAASQQRDSGTWIVTVSGELDLATAPELEALFEALEPTPPERVLVDLAAVTFLDSSGIRALVRANRRLTGLGVPLVVDAVSDAARQVLEISGVLDALS